MPRNRGWIAVACLALWAGLAQAQETAQTVIERSIQAHGGRNRLDRPGADRAKIKGTLFVNSVEVPFTSEILVQLPSKRKVTITMAMKDQLPTTIVQICNGDQAYVSINSRPMKPEASAVAEMRESLALARVVRLVPLLSDRSFQLSLLPETKVNDRPALAVKAEVKGRKPFLLYFDKATNFLVKTEHELDDGAGKSVTQEEFYSDFRDLAGFRRPIKMTVFRKGAKVMEAEFLEVKYYERVEDAEFAKP